MTSKSTKTKLLVNVKPNYKIAAVPRGISHRVYSILCVYWTSKKMHVFPLCCTQESSHMDKGVGLCRSDGRRTGQHTDLDLQRRWYSFGL